MAIQGKLELTIKINELPADVSVDKNGWKSFDLDCDGQIFSVTVKPKVLDLLGNKLKKPCILVWERVSRFFN